VVVASRREPDSRRIAVTDVSAAARARAKAPDSTGALAHTWAIFGLQLLRDGLKGGSGGGEGGSAGEGGAGGARLRRSDPTHCAMLGQMLPSLARCIDHGHPQLCAIALRLTVQLVRYPLPNEDGLRARRELMRSCLRRVQHVSALSASADDSLVAAVRALAVLIKPPPPLDGAGKAHVRRSATTAPAPAPAASGGDDGGDPAGEDAGGEDEDGSDDEDEDGPAAYPPDDDDARARDGSASKTSAPPPSALSLSDGQLRWLLEFVHVRLQEASPPACVFALLRAVIGRRYVGARLYDLAERLCELVLRAEDGSAREAAGALVCQFMITYPLGDGRVQERLQFVVTNLEYPRSDGRRSLLKLYAQLVRRLPAGALAKWHQLLFVPLVPRLSADPDASCRKAAAAVLESLLRRLSAEQGDVRDGGRALSSLHRLVLLWYADTDPDLRYALRPSARAHSRSLVACRSALRVPSGAAAGFNEQPLVVSALSRGCSRQRHLAPHTRAPSCAGPLLPPSAPPRPRASVRSLSRPLSLCLAVGQRRR
jgi:hypothetical protein